MKECEVANFHGQASDAYAYVWMVQGSLFFMDNTLTPVSYIEQKKFAHENCYLSFLRCMVHEN
jgi:hypothetical protein